MNRASFSFRLKRSEKKLFRLPFFTLSLSFLSLFLFYSVLFLFYVRTISLDALTFPSVLRIIGAHYCLQLSLWTEGEELSITKVIIPILIFSHFRAVRNDSKNATVRISVVEN